MEYYGSCLNPVEQEFYLNIIDTLKKRLLFVKADASIKEKDFFKCITAVQYDYPDLFYVEFQHRYYMDYEDGWEFRPKYRYNEEETDVRKEKMQSVVDQILLDMKKRGLTSVYQQCGYIHAYIVKNCTYDHESLDKPEERRNAYTIEGPLLDHTAVCQGIALAYRYICMQCGIEAIAVKGVSMQPGDTSYEKHAWNIIRVGENAAQVDATWDMNLTPKGDPVRYDYFFLPDIEMMRDHQYVGYPMCRKLNASYFERAGLLFSDLAQLDSYIGRKVNESLGGGSSQKMRLVFKLMNRKETDEGIQQFVKESIRKYTNLGYSWISKNNQAQSVYVFEIEWS